MAYSENAQKVLDFIQDNVQHIENQLSLRPLGNPSIKFKRITGLSAQTRHGEIQWTAKDHEVVYSFPGRTKDEAWRFACVLRILSGIHSALSDRIVVTKRDIFYHDPKLFLNQEVVDRYIDDIAHTCKVRRSDMNVIASPKGLVAGLVSDDQNEPETIPTSLNISLAHLKWVLVIEKEATFHTLVEQRCHLSDKVGQGLLVTVSDRICLPKSLTLKAKGYPDLATRQFLRIVADVPDFKGPILGLFDYDPYGIDILKCYRVGSKVSIGQKALAILTMKWIGVKSRDLMLLESGAMPMTQNDRLKAQRLLEAMVVESEVAAELTDCSNELQTMLMLKHKAEIQALDSGSGKLLRWVEDRIQEAL